MNISSWKHKGFTIAELLVVMLIMMIVGAALVPVIGMKRIKVPRLGLKHGVYQCFYDLNEAGTDYELVSYQQDNNQHKNGTRKIENGDSCAFELQPDSYYTIYGIGAGSAGVGTSNSEQDGDGRLANVDYSSSGKTENRTGPIDPYGDLEATLRSAAIPQVVRDLWLERNPNTTLYAGVYIQSGIGSNGNPFYGEHTNNNGLTECNKNRNDEECSAEIECAGGIAGFGRSGKIAISVGPNSTNINKPESTNVTAEDKHAGISVNIGNTNITLTDSGDGTSAYQVTGENASCQPGYNSNYNSKCYPEDSVFCQNNITQESTHLDARAGSVDATSEDAQLKYTYANPKFTYRYGPPGKNAEEKEVLFEKIKEKTRLTITPAYPGSNNPTTVKITREDGTEQILFQAESAEENNSNVISIDSIEISDIDKFVNQINEGKGIPLTIINTSDLVTTVPQFKSRYDDTKYNKDGSISKSQVNHGRGGTAAYKPISETVSLRQYAKIESANYSGMGNNIEENSNIQKAVGEYTCTLGSDIDTQRANNVFSNNNNKCKAGLGEPGAVVIEW